MRYITHMPSLLLYNRAGDMPYRFGQFGVLDLGTGNTIDATAKPSDLPNELQLVFTTDLDGNTGTRVEMAGQGTLDGVTATAATIPLTDGYNRYFFEAPAITPGVTTVVATADVYYEVLNGHVTYDGVEYAAREVFISDGTVTTTSTSDAGTFALTIPKDLQAYADQFRDYNFAIKHLGDRDEATGYYNFETGADTSSFGKI